MKATRRVVRAAFAIAARIAAAVAVDGYPPPPEAGRSSPLGPPLAPAALLDEDDPLDEVRPSSPTRKLAAPVRLRRSAKTAAVSAPLVGQSFPNRMRCLRSCSPRTVLSPGAFTRRKSGSNSGEIDGEPVCGAAVSLAAELSKLGDDVTKDTASTCRPDLDAPEDRRRRPGVRSFVCTRLGPSPSTSSQCRSPIDGKVVSSPRV